VTCERSHHHKALATPLKFAISSLRHQLYVWYEFCYEVCRLAAPAARCVRCEATNGNVYDWTGAMDREVTAGEEAHAGYSRPGIAGSQECPAVGTVNKEES